MNTRLTLVLTAIVAISGLAFAQNTIYVDAGYSIMGV